MSEFTPTPSQRDAIEARDSAFLIAAGAGSGKTKVLTERLMRYILDEKAPQSITGFVVITFTQDSAEELRSRISNELSRAAAAAEQNGDALLAVHIRRQQALCRKAMIGTIHHLCASILRENGHLLGLPSDFKIISSERAEAMKASALDRVLSRRYEELSAHPGFEELVNSVGTGRDDSRLAELVLQLYEKMRCHARPDAWAEECVRELKTPHDDLSTTAWGQEILNTARSVVTYWSAELDRLLALMQKDEVVFKAYGEAIQQGAEGVRELGRALRTGWNEACACTPAAFGRFKAVNKDYAPDLTELVKSRRDACKADMEKVKKMLYSDSASLSSEMAETTPQMEALLNLTLDFEKEYAARKRSEGLADYSDLEHFAVALLTDEQGAPTQIARDLAARYTEIMVDEYQDVSRVQEAVFHAISRGGKNLFMVGDVKQAIYRFRLADPEIFNEKYRTYPQYPEVSEEGAKILLRENFRSREEILNAANSVFAGCMSRQLGDIDYDADASLICGATGYEGTVPLPEIDIFTKPDSEKDKTAWEAERVAEKIEALISSGTLITDGGERRAVEYGDIAILLRNANSTGGAYRKALEKRGIPVSSGQGGGLFETKEVSFLLAMLRIMDNPHTDIPLIAVLSSPVFGFSADELAQIRAESPRQDFYDALNAYALTHEKAERFLALLSQFRTAAPDLTAEKLVRMILMKTDLLAVCSAMKDGRSRIANLMQMITVASRFESDGYHGLHRFVLYLTRLEKKNSAMTAAGAENAAVRILSIHRSKGLEFPVVFLCDTAHRFNTQDTEETVLVHPALGLGPRRTDREQLVQYPTLARKAIALRLKREMLSEEMRLLYVALTRPKELLFITAVKTSPEAFIAKQKMLLPLEGGKMEAEMLASAHSYIEWLTVAALADKGKTLRLRAEKAEPGAGEASAAAAAAQEEIVLSEEEIAAFEAKMAFAYPHASACTLPSKLTATELKHFEAKDDAEAAELIPAGKKTGSFRSPDFAKEDKALTGAERGIATHLALQYMDISKAFSPEGISSEIARLKEQRYLSPRQASAVSRQAIEKLFASPLGERIRNADALHREFRFSILCTAKELLQADSEDEILLQGVVDCCLEENGALVIIDYKTDRVFTEAQVQERCALYAGQVKAYAMALGRIFEKPVKETVLYFLSCDRMVSVH